MGSMSKKQETVTRLGIMKSERATWFYTWAEITAYLIPRNGRYYVQDRNRGWRRERSILDNSASRALEALAAGLMGGLTSPARPWFRLATSDEDLMQSHAVREWLARCTRVMLDIFARSNTYRALHTTYKELGAFGTHAAIVGDDFEDVMHIWPLTAGEYCLASNWKGEVDTLYREFQKPVGVVVREFGYKNVSTATKSLYDRGQLDQWITLIHAIEPRADRNPNMRDALNMPWRSLYFEQASDNDNPMRESGYKKFPALCPRWDVAGGDIYGNGPGMLCLGDIKQLQQEQLRKSQGIDYQTNPPLQVPTGLKNREVERLPGGVTYYDAAGQSGGIKTMFDVQLNLQYLLEDIQDVRQRIDSAFYKDLFLMIQGDIDVRKTATEVAELQNEKMLMLGPVLERLHNELLDPLVTMTFERMVRHGLVPPPPPELHMQPIHVELVSVLAQAQRAIATNGVDRFVMQLGQLVEIGKQDVLDKFDSDAWADRYSDMLGVDPELIVPDSKVALVRQQRAKMQAQQAQAQQAEQAANAASKLGNTPAPDQTNALGNVMGMFSQ